MPVSALGAVPQPVYVRPSGEAPPIVFLLGCDTASTAQQFSTHVGYFRRAGAAIIVSTVATVLGEHAVKVGTAIATKMLAAAKADHSDQALNHSDENYQFGEVLRDAKRQALLDSLPMALCVVAFGDADWRL